MKRFGLLILSMLCLIGCNKDTTPKEKTLTRVEFIELLPLKQLEKEINISSIDVSWDNKDNDEGVQEALKELGATDELKGERKVTDATETKKIREKSKDGLSKETIEGYFPEVEGATITYKERDTELEIDTISETSKKYTSYTYMKSNGVIKTFTVTSNIDDCNCTITDKFNYSYI